MATQTLRICYIGNFSSEHTTENDVRKAFEYLGHTVIMLQENKFDFAWLNYFEYDLLLITSTWDDAIDLDKWLGHMKNCAKRGIPTATLHLDTFWGTSRGNRRWWLNPMFHTAYIFTADGDYDKEWKAFGKNHIWLPSAVRHDACHFVITEKNTPVMWHSLAQMESAIMRMYGVIEKSLSIN